ncbi:unnamed protein product [Discosporangium mesarthrocarpum]
MQWLSLKPAKVACCTVCDGSCLKSVHQDSTSTTPCTPDIRPISHSIHSNPNPLQVFLVGSVSSIQFACFGSPCKTMLSIQPTVSEAHTTVQLYMAWCSKSHN